jgi:hypothetical protein
VDLSRLTDVPTSLEPCPDVVRGFREVDPRTELIYIGKGKWWVGIVHSDIPLIRAGEEEMAQIQASGGAPWTGIRLAWLKMRGFRRVLLHTVLPDKSWGGLTRIHNEMSWGHWLSRFRLQDYIYRHHTNSDASWHRLLLRNELGMMDNALQEKISTILDMVHADRKIILKRVRKEKFFTGLGGFLKRRAG